MGLDLGSLAGQTLLDDEEKDGLLIPAIATRGELDEFEQQNIEQAIQWAIRRTISPEAILSDAFMRRVLTRMFSDLWVWA